MTKLYLAAITVIALGGPAMACDNFQSIPPDQAQKLLETLSSKTSKSLDRVFAFNTLACSDILAVRRVALEEGLKSANDPVMKGQVLLEIFLQKDEIRVILIEAGDLPQRSRDWIKQHGGSLSPKLYFKDRRRGCITLDHSGRDKCNDAYQISIFGDKLTYRYSQTTGELRLQADNSLRGFIKPHPAEPPIPAKLELF